VSSPNISTTQVVIIGAGPTGLSMAAQLLRYEIDCIILEKNAGITSLSKAIVLQARTLEIFRELGIADEALKRGQETTHMNLFYKGQKKVDIDLAGLGEGLSEFAFALSLEQSKTEKLLAEHLTEKGKQVQWGATLTHFEQHNDGVTVYYTNASGIEQQVQASYIVGCDGAGSVVRHQLNLPFEGSTEPKLFYVADVVLNSAVINSNTLYMYMIKKGFILFFPMEGKGHYRIVGILPDHDSNADTYQFSDIEPVIKREIISPVEVETLRWFSTYTVHSRKANAFMQNRCFIAGDAAHIHTPAGGQGMNTGIQDAYNLAWKLAYTIRGEVNNEVLKSYDTERSANAKRLLQTTDRMFDIMSGVNRFWNFIRLSFFPPFLNLLSKSNFARKRIFPLLSQIGIAYPDSFLTIKSSIGKVKAGDRMPYFVFADGKQIFSFIADPVFKLLYFGNKPQSDPLPQSKLTMKFIAFTEIPHSIFGDVNDFHILLRPDNHISYIGKEVGKCRELINKLSTIYT